MNGFDDPCKKTVRMDGKESSVTTMSPLIGRILWTYQVFSIRLILLSTQSLDHWTFSLKIIEMQINYN